jgi:hypothetical protein
MWPGGLGSAVAMEHHFTLPVRVVEVTAARKEVDPETGDLLPPAPVSTDDGTPLRPPAKPDDEGSR